MKNLFLLVTFSFIFSSCTFRSLAFRNMTWLLEMKLDDLFDLNSEQSQQLETPIKDLSVFLKKDFGIRIVSFIEFIEQSKENGFSKQEIDLAITMAFDLRSRLLKQTAQPLSQLLKSLSAEQLLHYQKEQEEDSKELIELLSSDSFEKDIKKLTEERIDLLSEWYGTLDDKQEKLVVSRMATTKEQIQENLDYRQKSQGFLVDLIKTKSQADLEKFFLAWADDPTLRSRKLGFDKQGTWQDKVSEFIFEFHQTLSPKQWIHFAKELDGLKKDLQAISS